MRTARGPPPVLTVAVEVERDHHVEALRLVGEEGSSDVDDDAVAGDIRVLALADLLKDLVKQPVRQLHDVVLDDARHALAAVLARVVEGVADDLLAACRRQQMQQR